MELTPRRQAMIDTHVAETRRAMADVAFELNDLVRYAIAAARDKGGKIYYPMDPVNEGIRQWAGLSRKLAKMVQQVEQAQARLGHPPFDPEQPADTDPPAAP